MNTPSSEEPIVVGTGFVGLLLAGALAPLYKRLTLIAPRLEGPKNDTRAIVLLPGNICFFERLGLWTEALKKQTCPLSQTRIETTDGKELSLRGTPMAAVVQGSILHRHLRDSLPSNVHFVADKVERADQDANSAWVSTEGGKTYRGSYVLSAEGGGSSVRRACRIPIFKHDFRQEAWVTVIKCKDLPDKHVAYETFFPGTVIACLPMTAGRTNVVCTQKTGLSSEKFLSMLPNLLPVSHRDFRLVHKPKNYPLHQILAYRYGKNRIVLVGDAAHLLHPLGGQAFNLGIRDVASILSILLKSRLRGLPIVDLCTPYERERFFDNTATGLSTNALGELLPRRLAPRLFPILQKMPGLEVGLRCIFLRGWAPSSPWMRESLNPEERLLIKSYESARRP